MFRSTCWRSTTTATWAGNLIQSGLALWRGAVPCEDDIAEFYETAVERLERWVCDRYEISNFARAGFESRHNLKYWRREPYLGFGADAHSFDGESRWQNAGIGRRLCGAGPRSREPFPRPIPSPKSFFLGLRLTEGIERPFEPFADADPSVHRQTAVC